MDALRTFHIDVITVLKLHVNSLLEGFSQSWKRSGKQSIYLHQSLPTQCSGTC